MNENMNLDPLEGLPPELAELDRELAAIHMAERSSFAPELESELGRQWLTRDRWSRGPSLARAAMAASVAALLFAGLAVPPARASLVTRIQQILEVFQENEPAMARSQGDATPPGRGLVTLEPETDEAGDVVPERRPEAVVRETRSAGEPLVEFPAFRVPESTYPTLVDLESDRILMRRYYPPDLQGQGVGGTVGLLLWVDSTGAVDHVQMETTSGVPALDRAALQAAPSLRFHPTTRNGQPVGSWVEFDLVFEPREVDVPLPDVLPVADPALGPGDWEPSGEWAEPSVVPAPILLEAQELLRAALDQPREELEERFGPLDGLLAGDPPAGASPLAWRTEASSALERAMVRDPDNPAPYLALARIRRKQGLREDARLLLGGGVERAQRGARPVSPRLAAELAYEYGRALQEDWLPWRGLGRLPVTALDGRTCPRRAGPSGDVDAEVLIAWNYLCSVPLGEAMDEAFTPLAGGDDDRAAMLRSFREAVRAYPAHVGANVEILLDLADRGDWTQLLNQSRRFARASQGHPYALLMSGLALHRLARTEEAMDDLRLALEFLGDEVRAEFLDVRVLDPTVSGPVGRLRFWSTLDPLLSTEVNEREVEHVARGAYAYLRFGALDGDGARVWLRYGRPIGVRVFGTGGAVRTEFWDYGPGPDVTLARSPRSDDLALTPEARAYLDELARIYPHGVGEGAPHRAVTPLPAQVARFRGLQEGWVELEVALAVPEGLRAGAASGDSLELGLFLLSEDGRTLGEVRDKVAARPEVVRWSLPAAPEARRLVVELYNPRNHQAAAESLDLHDETAPASHMSDLLLVDGGTPAVAPFRRGGARVAPMGRTDRLDSDDLGVAFELYDLEAGVDSYRLRVELVSEATGDVRAVAFRPGGAEGYQAEWDRVAPLAGTPGATSAADGRTLEVLDLDLAPVPPGLYTLRVRVETSGGEAMVRERPGLRRRLADGPDAPPAGAMGQIPLT